MNNNPLMQFARRSQLSVKLPTNGNWYSNDIIELNSMGEVDVLPMNAKDELTLYNPDALLSGEATIQLIHSCVPQVKKAERLLYPDVNVLLLAIRQATYGKELILESFCPKCQETIVKINDKEEVARLEAEHKISTKALEFVFDIPTLLQTIDYLNDDYIMETEDGLKIHYSPNKLEDKLNFSIKMFQEAKLVQHSEQMKLLNADITEEEKIKLYANIALSHIKLVTSRCSIMANAISQIDLPDGSFVTDKEFIRQYLSDVNSSILTDLNEAISNLNDVGLPTIMEYQCNCCGHEWSSKFYGFNQSDFFGIGSHF